MKKLIFLLLLFISFASTGQSQQCGQTTKSGQPCRNKITPPAIACHLHGGEKKAKTDANSTAQECAAETKGGQPCRNRVKGGGRCHLHK